MLSIIIPTYNERENIPLLIKRLSQVVKTLGTGYEIIIVDDSSPDGTLRKAREASAGMNIRLLSRSRKGGLSSAIFRGFEESCGDIIMVMDADLSHPPEVIPSLLNGIEGVDMVIASRYVRGGRIINWSILRRVESRIAAFLAGPLSGVSDPLSGFFMFRRCCLQRNGGRRMGFKASLDILASMRNSRVKEIPYSFKDRNLGKSKMSVKIVFGFLLQLSLLFAKRSLVRAGTK